MDDAVKVERKRERDRAYQKQVYANKKARQDEERPHADIQQENLGGYVGSMFYENHFASQELQRPTEPYSLDLGVWIPSASPSQEPTHDELGFYSSSATEQFVPAPLPPPPPLTEETLRQDLPTEYVPISLVHVFSAFAFRIARASCCPTEHIGVRTARRRTISFCVATYGNCYCVFCSASFRTKTAAGFFAR